MSKNFIYFPSFSAGRFGDHSIKNTKIKDRLSIRFWENQYDQFQYPYFLLTGGHFYKKTDLRKQYGLENALVFGDSGGFQIASGALDYTNELVEQMFNWLENNSDIATNLDIPPRMKFKGKYDRCLEMSIENFKYFDKHQTGKTKFLNVLQGHDEGSYSYWYDSIKHFNFSGWAIGGAGINIYIDFLLVYLCY